MAGITDAEFLNKVIPFGFDTATLGGYSLDAKTIEASEKIIKRNNLYVLINGESVGQVASQTLTSMNVINNVTNILFVLISLLVFKNI